MKVGDLVKVNGIDGHVGTIVQLDSPSKRRMRMAMVHFAGTGVDAYPEGWLEVVNETKTG